MPIDETSHALLEQAHQAAIDYLEQLPTASVTPTDYDAVELASSTGLPQHSQADSAILQQLASLGEHTTKTSGGRYFGFVTGGILPIALASSWLVDSWNQNAALHVMSPLAADIESQCEQWLIELLGLPTQSVASFVTGSSAGNLCALAAARHRILKRKDWNVEQKGLQGAPSIRIVASASAHSSIAKAIAVLGLGTDNMIAAPVDVKVASTQSNCPSLMKIRSCYCRPVTSTVAALITLLSFVR